MKIIDTFLCIGGPADGRRYPVRPGYTSLKVEDHLPEPAHNALARSIASVTHTYNKYTINGHEYCFTVWLHEDSSPDDAFKRLIDCYAKGSVE